jgi:hypothetical protein
VLWFLLVLALAACDGSGEAVSTSAPFSTAVEAAEDTGCGKFEALKAAFPEAGAIGFTSREPVSRSSLRAPIWPGTCAAWWTTYRQGSAGVDVSLTLYKTHEQALVALAEPLYGPVERLSDGAFVRTNRSPASVDGVPKKSASVVSVYRNVFYSSTSIADEPISVSAQIRLHRGIDEGVLAVG